MPPNVQRRNISHIFILLKIFSILPVSSASAERSFSVLKYLKSYLRSTTSESRLNGLALLYVYKNIQITEDEIFCLLAKKKTQIKFRTLIFFSNK